MARPKIQAHIRRKVRQDCGFGCVICGMPIYDIDHIVEYSKVKVHKADNLVCLCPTHHRLKTWMTREMLLDYKANPFNKSQSATTTFPLYIFGDTIDIYPGNNHYNKVFTEENSVNYPIVVDNHALISIKKEQKILLLSFLVHDENDKLILQIVDNEIAFSTGVWDAVREGSTFEIYNVELNKAIQFDYSPDERTFVIRRADFYFHGWHVEVDSKGYLRFTRPDHPNNPSFRGNSIGSVNDPRFGCIISTKDGRGVDVGFMIGKSPSFDHLTVGMSVQSNL